jgi:hypothetical protein
VQGLGLGQRAFSQPVALMLLAIMQSIKRYNERVTDPATLRDRESTTRFFAGLELLAPGVAGVSQWRPDSDLTAVMPSSMWCGVARKR